MYSKEFGYLFFFFILLIGFIRGQVLPTSVQYNPTSIIATPYSSLSESIEATISIEEYLSGTIAVTLIDNDTNLVDSLSTNIPTPGNAVITQIVAMNTYRTPYFTKKLPFSLKLVYTGTGAVLSQTIFVINYTSPYYQPGLPTVVGQLQNGYLTATAGTSGLCTFSEILNILNVNFYKYYRLSGQYSVIDLIPYSSNADGSAIQFYYQYKHPVTASTVNAYNVNDPVYSYPILDSITCNSIIPTIDFLKFINLDMTSKSYVVFGSDVKVQNVEISYQTANPVIYSEITLIDTLQNGKFIYSLGIYKISSVIDSTMQLNIGSTLFNPTPVPSYPSMPNSGFSVNSHSVQTQVRLPGIFTKLVSPSYLALTAGVTCTEPMSGIDFFVVSNEDGQRISPHVYPITTTATYFFPLPGITSLTTMSLASYSKSLQPYINQITLTGSISILNSLAVLSAPGTITNLSNYEVTIQNLHALEYPTINTQIEIDQTVITKSLQSQFPFNFKGIKKQMIYTPYIPFLPDTATGVKLNILSSPQLTIIDNVDNPLNPGDKMMDLIAPLSAVFITYTDGDGNGTLTTVSVKINLRDFLGIDNDRCKLSYGPYSMTLSPQNRIRGGPSGDSTYVFRFQLNRYFCDAPIEFICEDLRGSRIQWNTNDLVSISTVLTKSGDCRPSSSIYDIKLISIDSTMLTSNGAGYSPVFYVTLSMDGENPQHYNINLLLNNVNPLGTNFNVAMTYNDDQVPPGSSGVNSYIYQFGTLNPTITESYRYGIEIQNSLTLEIIELSFAHLEYISSQTTADLQFQNSVTFKDSNFAGISAIFGLSFGQDGQLEVTLFQGSWDDIKNIVISYSDDVIPYTRKYTLIPGGLSTITQAIPWTYGFYIWLSEVCDTKGYCQEYPTEFLAVTGGKNPAVSYPSYTPIVDRILTTPINIDTTSQQRTVNFYFVVSSNITLDITHKPIMLLTEKYSGNILQIPCTIGGATVTCNGVVPVNWGQRGLIKSSVQNIVLTNGFLTYIEFDTISIKEFDFKAHIWSVQIDPLTLNLKVTGSSLGYLVGSQNRPILKSDNVTYYLDGKFQDETTITLEPIGGPIVYGSSNILVFDGQSYTISLPTSGCTNKCSGNGVCSNGQCICIKDWDGFDCSISEMYQCLNNCSGKGTCQTNICNCNSGFMGPSCETKVDENSKVIPKTSTNETAPSGTFYSFEDTSSSTTSSSGTLTQSSKLTNFTILLTKVEELNLNNNAIKTYDLTSVDWTFQSLNESISQYSISLTNGSLLTVLITTTRSNTENIQFANQTLQIPPNSIKYYIKLENYTFQSQLNHLEFSWETYAQVPNPCVTSQQNITIGGDNNDFHYFIIPANQLSLYGRFSNLIVVDGRVFLSSNQAKLISNDKMELRLTTPHFKTYTELDPDFSVLVDLNSAPVETDFEYDENCNIISKSTSTRPKYFLPVVIAVPVVVVSIIVLSIAILYKKSVVVRTWVLGMKSKLSGNSIKMTKF
ncbi:hypothetical protein DLAC_09706 [Tieghemostelium lacteum]|uniref:EGF-like domain-containing protein n=1 Tax=Tieghemostelium lacteum TaxID=361077 RepID=A0A151Z726_TIELA|nr:hypothetical protein DLAC_09706 [Tieghemostelium lacteum]|eukprot:KYQ89738.1 hypothetical protein DLAC_09706 [Tieghemostelium lacteum]